MSFQECLGFLAIHRGSTGLSRKVTSWFQNQGFWSKNLGAIGLPSKQGGNPLFLPLSTQHWVPNVPGQCTDSPTAQWPPCGDAGHQSRAIGQFAVRNHQPFKQTWIEMDRDVKWISMDFWNRRNPNRTNQKSLKVFALFSVMVFMTSAVLQRTNLGSQTVAELHTGFGPSVPLGHGSGREATANHCNQKWEKR